MLAEYILKEFYYTDQLPIWNHLIEEDIKKKISTWTRDPTENAERLDLYWPLWLQFIGGFSKKPLDDNPHMLKALASMVPEAYAIDAAYKINQKKSFDSIVQGHVDAVGAMWAALNILGYALEAAQKEFVGKQTARMALGFKNNRIDLTRIVNKACKKAGYFKLANAKTISHIESDIESVVNEALAQLLNKSAKKTPLLDSMEIPPGQLGDKIRDILSHFDPSTAQAQDAITGKHQIATTRARDIFFKEGKAMAKFQRKNPDKIIHLDHIAQGYGGEDTNIAIQLKGDDDEAPDRLYERKNNYDMLIIDIARAKKKLTRKQRYIIERIESHPNDDDTKIAQALQITRKTVYNCKQRMRDLLTHPTK